MHDQSREIYNSKNEREEYRILVCNNFILSTNVHVRAFKTIFFYFNTLILLEKKRKKEKNRYKKIKQSEIARTWPIEVN